MRTVIDVHCHTFNADQIPIKGYIHARFPVPMVARVLEKLIQKLTPDDRAGVSADMWEEIPDAYYENLIEQVFEENPELDEESAVDARMTMDDRGIGDIGGKLVRAARWLHRVMHRPGQVVGALMDRFSSVTVFVPLMMDMEYLVKGDDVEMDIYTSVNIMSEMIRELAGTLHPFIPFNPIRELKFSGTSRSSLAVIRNAIETRGFIGVKFYPPMGYRPAGNEHISVDIQQRSRYDDLMASLFDYCAEMDIPVTTHCTPAGAQAGKNYGMYSEPDFWRPVLENHPDLRLNFAHFGSCENLVTFSDSRSWTRQIIGLMDQYEHVYADISFNEYITDDDRSAVYISAFKQMLATHPVIQNRIMYGSDWHMIMNAEGYKEYLARFETLIDSGDVCCDPDGFFYGNAMRFLGLTPGQRNRTRLERFYEINNLPLPGWLAG